MPWIWRSNRSPSRTGGIDHGRSLVERSTFRARLSRPAPGRSDSGPGRRRLIVDRPHTEVRDEAAHYRKLVELLHPGGLTCPRCKSRKFVGRLDRGFDPAPTYRCARCHRDFDAWTGTLLRGTGLPPSELFGELLLALDRVA